MKYYCVLTREDESKLKNYIVHKNETGDVFLISFDENDKEDIIKNTDISVFIDGKRKIYKFDNGEIVPFSDKKFSFTPAVWYKKFCRVYSNMHKEQLCRDNKLRKFSATYINKSGIDISAFKSFEFVDKENEIVYPFRFKKSKGNKSEPLVIYFCGAGAVGMDNMKPFFECVPMLRQLNKYNCNILIPQSNTDVNYNRDYDELNFKLDRYTKSVGNLVGLLKENYNIDKDRIYVFGTSFGGFCTWRLVYHNPELCACAIPVMGGFDDIIENSVYTDFERFVNVPIWAAHSSDDECVSIKFDDYAVERIKKLGGNIKYSRWDKYGHGMARHFYKKEKWCDYMFEQKLNH